MHELECGKLCHYDTKDIDGRIRLNGCFQTYTDHTVKQLRILCIISLTASCVLIIAAIVSFLLMMLVNFNIPSVEI